MYKVILIILILFSLFFSCQTKQKHSFEEAVYIENDTIPIKTELDSFGIVSNSNGLALNQVIEDDVVVNNIEISDSSLFIYYQGTPSQLINKNKRVKAHKGLVFYQKNREGLWDYNNHFILCYLQDSLGNNFNLLTSHSLRFNFPYLYVLEMNKPEIIDSKDDEHDFKHEFWSFKFENGKWDHLNAIPFETINQEDNKLAHVPGIGIHEDKMYLMGDGNTLGIYEIQKNNNNVTIELIDSINVKRDIPMDLPSIRINKLIRQNNHLIILSSFHSKERKAKINKHYDPNKTLSFKKVFYNPKINFLNHYKFDSNTKEYKLVPKDTLTFINEHGQYKWGTNLDEHHFLDDISNDTLTKYVIYKIFYDEQKGINRNITREFIFDQEQEILPIDSNSFYFFSEEINPQNEYIFNENTIDTLRFNALPNYAHYTQQVRTTANQLIILKHYEENIDPETLIINSDAFKNKEIGINELCGERIEFLKNRRYRSKIFFLNTSN